MKKLKKITHVIFFPIALALMLIGCFAVNVVIFFIQVVLSFEEQIVNAVNDSKKYLAPFRVLYILFMTIGLFIFGLAFYAVAVIPISIDKCIKLVKEVHGDLVGYLYDTKSS